LSKAESQSYDVFACVRFSLSLFASNIKIITKQKRYNFRDFRESKKVTCYKKEFMYWRERERERNILRENFQGMEIKYFFKNYD
jgi:hypothetical protein